eukprot:804905-Pleurochrysis_carterae.AAC.3
MSPRRGRTLDDSMDEKDELACPRRFIDVPSWFAGLSIQLSSCAPVVYLCCTRASVCTAIYPHQ